MADSRNEILSEELYNEFDSTTLLVAVEHLDKMRHHLADNGYEPPEVRDDLLKLHRIVMESSNQARHSIEDVSDAVNAVEYCIDEIQEQAEKLKAILSDLNNSLNQAWERIEQLDSEEAEE